MRSILLMMAFFVMVLPALKMPQIGVMIWSWIAFMNPHREAWGGTAQFEFNMIIAVVTLGAWLFSKEPLKLPKTPATVLLIIFALHISLTTFVAEVNQVSYPIWDRTMKSLVLVFAIMGLINSRVRIHAMIWVIVISLSYWGVKGTGFMILSGGRYSIFGPTNSMIFDNNHLAAALIMTIPLINYLRLHSANKWVRIGLVVVLFMTVFAVIGTYSRGGFIGLTMMGMVYWWRSRGKFVGAMAIMLVVIVGLIAMPQKYFDRINTISNTEEDSSFQGRLVMWETAILIAKAKPLTGVGFRAYEKQHIFDKFNPGGGYARAIHSIYFETLADHGYPGLILFLSIAFLTWRNSRWIVKHTRRRPDLAWAHDLGRMMEVSLAGYLVAGAALSLAYYDMYLALVAITAAVRVVVSKQLTAKPRVIVHPAMAPSTPLPGTARTSH